jgi:hypothetical protein
VALNLVRASDRMASSVALFRRAVRADQLCVEPVMIRRLLALAVVSVMLPGGCVAGDQGVPNVQYEKVTIDHPVPCVPTDKKPTLPTALGPKPADARQGEAMLLAKLQEWLSYGDHAQPLLDACTKIEGN